MYETNKRNLKNNSKLYVPQHVVLSFKENQKTIKFDSNGTQNLDYKWRHRVSLKQLQKTVNEPIGWNTEFNRTKYVKLIESWVGETLVNTDKTDVSSEIGNQRIYNQSIYQQQFEEYNC
jgi:hypothetical protein